MGPRYVLQLLFSKKSQNCYNSAITEAREKISTDWETVEFYLFLYICLTKFENYQILLNKISHRYLATTKLFGG
jgi:hypothetical protein